MTLKFKITKFKIIYYNFKFKSFINLTKKNHTKFKINYQLK